MNLYQLTVGTKVLLTNGATAEVVAPTEDGRSVEVRYLEAPFNPELVGTESTCSEDEVVTTVESRSLWGQGLATEAAEAVLVNAFAKVPELVRAEATVDPRNVASARVLKKLGMERAGVRMQRSTIRGERVDEAVYWISRSAFDQR